MVGRTLVDYLAEEGVQDPQGPSENPEDGPVDPWAVGEAEMSAVFHISVSPVSYAYHAVSQPYSANREARTFLHAQVYVVVGKERSQPGWGSSSGRRVCSRYMMVQVDQPMMRELQRGEHWDRETEKAPQASTISTWSCHHCPLSVMTPELAAHDRQEML